MTEATPREPHTRTYEWGDGNTVDMAVDQYGLVSITEELLDLLFHRVGFQEVPRD